MGSKLTNVLNFYFFSLSTEETIHPRDRSIMPCFINDYLSFDVHIEETKKKDRKSILMLLTLFSLTWKKIPTWLVFGRRGYPKSKLKRRRPSMASLLIPRRVRKEYPAVLSGRTGFLKVGHVYG